MSPDRSGSNQLSNDAPSGRPEQRIHDATAEGIVGLDCEGRVTFVDAAGAQMTGHDTTDLIGRRYHDIVHHSTPDGSRSCCEQCPILHVVRRGGSRFQGHDVFRRADGTSFQVECTATPIEDGEQIVGAVVIVREITERAAAAEALSRRRDALLAEAQLLTGVGSWDWNVRENTVAWSDELYRINGLDPEQFTPSYEGFLETIHPDDVEMVTREVEQAFAQQGSFTYDHRTVRPDGTVRVIAARGRAITNATGEVVSMIGTAQDITERDAVDRMKSEFISVVGHELRTPLTSIRGALGLLAAGALGRLPEKGQRILDIAVENSSRLGRLIDDILDIERIESGSVCMRTQAVEAGQLIEQARQTVQAMADDAGVTLTVHAVHARLRVDQDRIVQTLTNLLSNAIKFSDPGATVTLTAETSADEVIFGVRDEGPGIPADQTELIFERFHQVERSNTRAHAGTGLGLAISRSIVNQHHGRIWVQSELGKGSTFVFALPAANQR